MSNPEQPATIVNIKLLFSEPTSAYSEIKVEPDWTLQRVAGFGSFHLARALVAFDSWQKIE